VKTTFLNIALLQDQPLRFAYGISVSHGKDGNSLLAKLGAVFEQEYLIRQGKLAIIGKNREPIPLDFSDFSIEELSAARGVFWALSRTFKTVGHKPSGRLFSKIAMLCHASMQAQAGIGLA